MTTNAPTGYTVYAEENDQMGKDGVACSGATPSVEPFTYTGPTYCIRDYNKGAATFAVSPVTDRGTGGRIMVLVTLSKINQVRMRSFCITSRLVLSARNTSPIREASQNKYTASANVMTNTGPVSGSSVYVCYRIHIPATQPAGYYFNKLKYTAVAKF